MKISHKNRSTVLVIMVCLLSITLSSCKLWHRIFGSHQKTPQDYHKYISYDTGFQHIPPDSTQQIVIWRDPNSDPAYLNQWLDSINEHCGSFHITVFCGSCDSSLMLLSGNGIRTFIQGTGGGKGGGTGCHINCPSGSGDTIYWSVNFPIDVNDSTYDTDTTHKAIGTGSFSDTAITVAVFDTGIDPFETHPYLYESDLPACLDPMARNGWNFPDKNNDVRDDYNSPTGHGATVSRLIIEQVTHYLKNKVKILPVKIHNQHGQSDLFSILCGFAYAKDRGAKIINASFGYYALKQPPVGGTLQPDAGALLLKKYIQFYLTNNNILLIAAAGNEARNHDADVKALYINAGLPVPADLRNLDNVYFYPASLAADPELPNVISVTTVDLGSSRVSPHQNYSPEVVDLGVNADIILGDHFDFRNPRVTAGFSEGSSYATPIVTGLICSHYDLIKQNLSTTPFTKENILRILLRSDLHLGETTTIGGKIKTGVMLNNTTP